MLPGKSKVYVCPHCGAYKAVWSLASSNSCCGVNIWSDGKFYHSMQEYASMIQRCPSCKHYFIIYQAESHLANSVYTINKGELPYANLKEALSEFEAAGLDQKQLYDIRMIVLHAYNDLYGYAEKKDIPTEESDYIKRLIGELLPMTKDVLFQAELYREMGEFSKCIDVLNHIKPESRYYNKEKILEILDHCLHRDFNVYLIEGSYTRMAVREADNEPPYDPKADGYDVFPPPPIYKQAESTSTDETFNYCDDEEW